MLYKKAILGLFASLWVSSTGFTVENQIHYSCETVETAFNALQPK